MKSKNKKVKITKNTIIFSTLFFVLFGTLTVLIPNKFFARMTSVGNLDYIFLILTSLLLGMYVSLYLHQKKENKKCNVSAASGGIFGFLGFGCSICNKILILFLGVAGVLTYVEPYRPFIGFVGVGLMSYAVYTKYEETNLKQ